MRLVDKTQTDNDLLVAAEDGDLEKAKRALKDGADVDAGKDKHGETPLHLAGKGRYDAIVAVLLENSADVNAKDKFQATPLHHASTRGHETVASLLLDNGADVNTKDGSEQTPIHKASKGGYEKISSLLLENGADVNVKGWNGNTPLYDASYEGHKVVVSVLLENGADVNAKDDYGNTPLHNASYEGRELVVSVLLEKGADFNAQDDDGETPLDRASENGQRAIVSLLLEKGATGNAEEQLNNGILRQVDQDLLDAADDEEFEKVKRTLKDGADVNARDDNGVTPHHFASRCGNDALVEILLKHGADVSAQTKYASTPLYDATGNGYDTFAANGFFGVHATGKFDGSIPLHQACFFRHNKVVSLLLEKGNTIHVKDKGGDTPLHKASMKGHVSVVSLLLEKEADINAKGGYGMTSLNLASENGHEAMVMLLLLEGAKVEITDTLYEHTPLHVASENGHDAIVSLLLENDVDVNVKDKYGNTPLHLASTRGYETIVSLLLASGAEINAKATNEKTPLHNASCNGKKAIVSLLLENGADVNAKGENADTPLYDATRYGHEHIVSLLLENGANRLTTPVDVVSTRGFSGQRSGTTTKRIRQIKEERAKSGHSRNPLKREEKKTYLSKVINQHPSRQVLVVIVPSDEKDTVEKTRAASINGSLTGAGVSGEKSDKYERIASRHSHKTIAPAGGVFNLSVKGSKQVFLYLLFPKNVDDSLYYLSESNSFNVKTCNFIVEESDFDENLPTVHVTFNGDGTIDIASFVKKRVHIVGSF